MAPPKRRGHCCIGRGWEVSAGFREAVSGGWNPKAYAQACGNTAPLDEPPLF